MEIGSALLYIGILSWALALISLVSGELKDSGRITFFVRLVPHARNLIRISRRFPLQQLPEF